MIEFGNELFRIHPKGTGVICTNPNGIAPHVVISEYLGELYPAYRWCEKLDVVQQAQTKYGLKPTLPDFYNILLERPRQDPKGYSILYVDASQRANLGSSCSHSCNANCTSSVVARNGKLVIVLTTNRYIHMNEELSMDYFSVTTSDIEWRASVCLCGMTSCRGSFLHYATQDDLQQVLNQNCGPLWRYSSLLRSCAMNISANNTNKLHISDVSVLDRHGMKQAAFGLNPSLWIQKYIADNLKFIEFERKALPCALLRTKTKSKEKNDENIVEYTYSEADMEARTIMEQRIQSLVACISMVNCVLDNQTIEKHSNVPLIILNNNKSKNIIINILKTIPILLNDMILTQKETKKSIKNPKKSDKKSLINLNEKEITKGNEAANQNRINVAIYNINKILENNNEITNISSKILCLDVRNIIVSLIDIETPIAR